MNPLKKLYKAEKDCLQILSTQTISLDGPGTILRDFQTMLELFESGFITKTGKGESIDARCLAEVNARLSQPIQIGKTRALLRDYPNIAGLFVLLRVMDLLKVKKGAFALDPEGVAKWRSLNPVEQYFTLLEAWLFVADDSMLGKTQKGRKRDQFDGIIYVLTSAVSSAWRSFHHTCHMYSDEGAVSDWNTQLLIRFGLLEVEPWPVEGRKFENRGWIMAKARRTAGDKRWHLRFCNS